MSRTPSAGRSCTAEPRAPPDVAGASSSLHAVARGPFDERTLDALFEIGRGNLRATDDLALKSLDYAAAAGHATVSVQHVVAARKDLWP